MTGAIRTAALSCLWLAAACATTTSEAPSAAPSAQARTQFGAVSVVLIPETVQYEMHAPTTGWANGLLVGTGRGLAAIPAFVVVGASLILYDPSGSIAAGAIVGGGAMSAVYFPYSVITGALTTVPRAEVDAALPAFRAALEDPSLPERLRVEFSRRAEAHLGGHLVPADQATTVMEIRLQSIRTGSPVGVSTLDDVFDVEAVASLRVVRQADGHVVSESVATDGTPNPEDGGRQFLVWADRDAELLRHRLDEAMIGLAESLAEVVFVADAQPVEPAPPPPPPPLFTPDEIDRMWSGQS